MWICLCTPVGCIVYVYTGEYNLSTFVDIVRDMGENGVREACRSNTTNAPDGMVVHFECPLLCLQPTPTRVGCNSEQIKGTRRSLSLDLPLCALITKQFLSFNTFFNQRNWWFSIPQRNQWHITKVGIPSDSISESTKARSSTRFFKIIC